jgi:hypothetical protein
LNASFNIGIEDKKEREKFLNFIMEDGWVLFCSEISARYPLF